MDGKDLLKSLETVYILPGNDLVFITSKELAPEVLRYAMEQLKQIFPEQTVNLISSVHTVLIKREEEEFDPNPVLPFTGKVTGHYRMVKIEDEEPEKAFLDDNDRAWQLRQEAEPLPPG